MHKRDIRQAVDTEFDTRHDLISPKANVVRSRGKPRIPYQITIKKILYNLLMSKKANDCTQRRAANYSKESLRQATILARWQLLASYALALTMLISVSSNFDACASSDSDPNLSLAEACGKSPDSNLLSMAPLATPGDTPVNSSIPQKSTVTTDTTTQGDRVEELTKAILRSELQLQKLNTQFRIETALTSRWRQRRVFLYGETSAVCTETSLFSSLSARMQLLRSRRAATKFPLVLNDPVETDDDPERNQHAGTTGATTSNSSTKNGAKPLVTGAGRTHGRLQAVNELQMAGTTVAATGDVIELGINFLHYWQIRHRGFTPALYREKVHKIARELDTLILQRQQAISQRGALNEPAFQLESCEGKMLSDLRDLAMVDYMEYHAATKRFWALQNTAFLLDFVKNEIGVTGNIIGLAGSHVRRPAIGGSAGVCASITGAMVMLQPIVGRVTGNISGTAARKLVSKELVNVNVRTSDIFASDRNHLLTMYNHTSQTNPQETSGLAHRLPLYAEQERLMNDMNSYFQSERRRARGTLNENVTFASIVGPARISNSVTTTVGAWRYYNDTSGRERLNVAGNTVYAFGGALNVLETARVQASEELRQYRLGKTHRRAGQRFKARIVALDKLHNSLK